MGYSTMKSKGNIISLCHGCYIMTKGYYREGVEHCMKCHLIKNEKDKQATRKS